MASRLSGRHQAWVALGLVLCVFVLYGQALRFDFTLFDDHRVLLDQARLFGPGPLGERIRNLLIEAFPREEPLIVRDLTWLLDSRLFGFGNPYGYHLFNLIYHAGAVVALFCFLHGFTRQWVTALGGAIVFASLAVAVEPVAWIMGRKDLLAGLFLLLALNTELRFHRTTGPPGRAGWYLAGWLCVVLACLSKASALVFPVVLLLLKWTLRRVEPPPAAASDHRLTGWVRPLAEVVPHLLVSALVYRWYRGVISDYGVLVNATAFEGMDRLKVLFLVDPLVALRYAGMVLVPHDLSVQYLWDGLGAVEQWPQRFLAIAIVLALAGTALALIRKRPRAAFLFISFFVLLVPYSNLLFFGWWNANRYVYAAAPFLIATLGLFACPYRRNRAAVGIAAGIVGLAVWNVVVQQRYLPVWRDGESLWRYEVGLPQATLRTYNNLISTYVSMALRASPLERPGLLERGKATVRTALARYAEPVPAEVDPSPTGLVLTYYAQGLLRTLAGDELDQQLQSFRRAHEINPRHAGVNDSLGEVYYRMALEQPPGEARTALARNALDHFGRVFGGEAGSEAIRARKAALVQRFRAEFPTLSPRELSDALGPIDPSVSDLP